VTVLFYPSDEAVPQPQVEFVILPHLGKISFKVSTSWSCSNSYFDAVYCTL